MKKTLSFLVLFLTISSITAQGTVDRTNFRAGLNVGLITGEVSDFYSFSLGVDALYVWGLSKELDLGLATGFNNAFGEEESISDGGLSVTTEFSNLQYIPAAMAIRIYPSYGFKLGGDIGYALVLSDNFDSGLYYSPLIGVDINRSTELNLSYTGISGDTAFSTVMVGVLFLF